MQTNLDVLQHSITVNCARREIHEELRHDFGYFLCQNSHNAFGIHCHPSNSRPRRSNTHRVCFFRSAYVDYDFSGKVCHIYCDDQSLLYETLYLVLLSFVGESLDKQGNHRLHGFGFVSGGKGSVLLAPSGGGKSTLALELLKSGSIQILSDDTPVITSDGKMRAFPQRIALKKVEGVPEKHLRRFKRAKHGEKWVIGSSYFAKNIATTSEINWLILTKHTTEKSRIRRISKLKLVWPLLKWLVVGYETPQIWQLYLRRSPKDVLQKLAILGHRLQTAGTLLRKAQGLELALSPDPKECAATVQQFMESR